jgi:hypothetical protein
MLIYLIEMSFLILRSLDREGNSRGWRGQMVAVAFVGGGWRRSGFEGSLRGV